MRFRVYNQMHNQVPELFGGLTASVLAYRIGQVLSVHTTKGDKAERSQVESYFWRKDTLYVMGNDDLLRTNIVTIQGAQIPMSLKSRIFWGDFRRTFISGRKASPRT